MVKYKIMFTLDIEDSLEYDSDEQNAEILEIDDSCFDETFDNKEKIQEFQNWFNDGLSDTEKISLIDIKYTRDEDEICILEVTSESEIDDKETFANELVYYLFEGDYPIVKYHISGTTYEDYWNYHVDSPDQRPINVDYDTSNEIHSYSKLNIQKIM